MGEPCDSTVARALIKKSEPAEISGLTAGSRLSHLQKALNVGLTSDVAELSRLAYSENQLPPLFWAFQTNISTANLSALGTKVRPTACEGTLRKMMEDPVRPSDSVNI